MRELKFRAFDTENKTWTFVTLGDLICGACTENGDKPLSGAEQVWEQYTGLKDENGKEIYEGDILESTWNGGKAVVAWNNVEGEWEHYADFNAHSKYGSSAVIGNIHEDPELLEEKKNERL